MKFIYSITLFLVCLLCFTTSASSQTKVIDSLENQLLIYKKKDTIRVNLLNEIANLLSRKDFDRTISYLDDSEEIARSIDFQKGLAKSVFLRGLSIVLNTKYNSGYQYYEEALLIYKQIGDKKGQAIIYFNMGVFKSRNKDYITAIDNYLNAIKIKEEIGDKEIYYDVKYLAKAYYHTGDFGNGILNYKKAVNIAKQKKDTKKIEECLLRIGTIYNHQGNYSLALEHFKNALASAEKNGHDINIGRILLSIGNVYIRLQKYDKAIEYHENALIEIKNAKKNTGSVLHNLGESYKYKKNYKKALDLFEKSIVKFKEKNHQANVAISLNKIGEIYYEQNKIDSAYIYFKKAEKVNLDVNNPRGLCGSYLGLAKVHYNKKRYNQSINLALKGKELSKKLELLDLQRDIEDLLSKVYEKTGSYKKAFTSHQEFKSLNDSLFNKENIEKITQLEYEYKYKQAIDSANIRELKLTKTVKATSQDLKKSQRNNLLAVIGVLLVSILLGAIIFYQKLKNAKSKTQNAVIEQKLLRSQMTPHFIFNSLSVLQGMILNKEEKKSIHYLSKFSKLLRITLENSRDKTVSLSQELKAVQDYLTLQNLENEAYKCTILVEDSIDAALFEVPPMLIQPFVENAIEHAFVNQKEDKKIDICLKYVDKKLICTIADNGIGINYKTEDKNTQKNSLATTITSERLKMLSKDFKMEGSVTVQNRKIFGEKGTLVTLVIPFKT